VRNIGDTTNAMLDRVPPPRVGPRLRRSADHNPPTEEACSRRPAQRTTSRQWPREAGFDDADASVIVDRELTGSRDRPVVACGSSEARMTSWPNPRPSLASVEVASAKPPIVRTRRAVAERLDVLVTSLLAPCDIGHQS